MDGSTRGGKRGVAIDGGRAWEPLRWAEGEMMGEGDQEETGPEASERGVYIELARPAVSGNSARIIPASPAPVFVCRRSWLNSLRLLPAQPLHLQFSMINVI